LEEPDLIKKSTDSPEIDFVSETDSIVDESFEVFRQPDEITVYPFTEEELSEALEVAAVAKEKWATIDGTLSFVAERLAYDPILTDIHIRQQIAGAPIAGWSEEDYYSHCISFTLVYSASYDHEKTFMSDEEHCDVGIHLYREDTQSTWQYSDDGIAITPITNTIMDTAQLSGLECSDGRILAAYSQSDSEVWTYQLNEESGEISFIVTDAETQPSNSVEVWPESIPQSGEAVTPQPGDTTETWDPSRAELYPSDEDCSDMELLEKWMAVEGLELSDLDALDCEQLILVVARETDGVETDTTCYERTVDGTWTSVPSLTRMNGYVGANGIMHNRKRGTVTSPAGLWALGSAFGNAEKPDGLKMPWRDVTPNSDWVCDEDSIYFNTWQERDDPELLEGWSDDVEHLEDYPDAYAYACVIRYNTQPYTIPERGCAIFLHCSEGATGGCVGLSKTDMVNTLLWLDPDKTPYILISGVEKGDLVGQ
jgi:L,D-peptidoglycan transpeptidase YkuD (ErfK/YbiS/YcfS/YnhG family)